MTNTYVDKEGEWREKRVTVMEAVGSLIQQLKESPDVTKVSLPAVFCHPYSSTELEAFRSLKKVEILLEAKKEKEPLKRMIKVIYWLLTVVSDAMFQKKPYNPVLGETMEMWTNDEKEENKSGKTVFFAEQVSHHPPILASVLENQKHGIRAEFAVNFSAKFLGNSASVKTVGSRIITLVEDSFYSSQKEETLTSLLSSKNKKEEKEKEEKFPLEELPGEKYFFSNFIPDLWLKNVLIGTRRHAWDGTIKVVCPSTGLKGKIIWSEKGEGTYMYPIYTNVVDVIIEQHSPFSSFTPFLDEEESTNINNNSSIDSNQGSDSSANNTPSPLKKEEETTTTDSPSNNKKKKKKSKKQKKKEKLKLEQEEKEKQEKLEKEGEVVAKLRGVAGGDLYYLDENGKEGKPVFSSSIVEKPMQILPKEERPVNSSIEIWGPLSDAIASNDLKTADKVKREIEQNQRKIRKEREEKGETHIPLFFGQKYGTWLYKFPTVVSAKKSDFEKLKAK